MKSPRFLAVYIICSPHFSAFFRIPPYTCPRVLSFVLFARIKGIKRHEVEDHEERLWQGKQKIARSSDCSIPPVFLFLLLCACVLWQIKHLCRKIKTQEEHGLPTTNPVRKMLRTLRGSIELFMAIKRIDFHNYC